MRNSSLIKRSCAENVTGLKHATEAASFAQHLGLELKSRELSAGWSGRGALISRRSSTERCCGALSSENAGMSNHKAGENPAHRKSEVSWAMVIIPGLVGPKARRYSVADGQQVNNPVPVYVCLWMRGMVAQAGSWLYPSNWSNWPGMKGCIGS